MSIHTTEMKVINSISEMHALSNDLRRSHKIAFVPTMGYLHEGHLALVRRARELADIAVVSIFVNPIQFGPKEDLAKYPRDFDRDAQLLEKEQTDIIFYPAAEEMYTDQFSTYVEVRGLQDYLCGQSRPGHFLGVATVVTKLFNIVKPHYAVFGQKDYQQLVVIRRMARDLNMDIDIVGHPTVREKDGLAMSSRNTYLSREEREKALLISRSLKKAEQLFSDGQRDASAIRNAVAEVLKQSEDIQQEYISINDAETLAPVDTVTRSAVLAIACRIGKTRLIDNTILSED